LLDAITKAKADADGLPASASAAERTAAKNAITAAINAAKDASTEVSDETVAKESDSVLILIPTIDTPDSIEPLAKYVKIDDIFDSILKAEQTVIFGGKKSKSKKQRKNKANKRKSVRH